MRTEVVHPGRTLRQVETTTHRVIKQLDLTSRQRLPQQRHEQRVVAYLALLRADVAQHVVGVDDRLGLEQHHGGSYSHQGVKCLDDLVSFWLVLAAGPHALPDEGDRVEPEDLHAGVGDEEHLLGHRAEDCGVGVVQIPLEAVEGRPDPLLEVLTPGEAPAAHGGEDVTQGALVDVRQRPVGEEEVEALVLGVASLRAPRPLMLVGGVVEDEVEHQADAMLLELARQLSQLFDRAQPRVDAAVAADGVAAVTIAIRRVE